MYPIKNYHCRLLKYSFLLSLGILFFSGRLGAQEIRVMTFNIYHGEQYYDRGTSNLKQVAEVINQYKPDFVALQEVDSMTTRSANLHGGVPKDFVQELAAMTGMYGFFAKAIDYSNGGYGEGVLSRFPAQATSYQLPIPEGGEGRALLTISPTLPDGQPIIFAGTHLCHEFDKNRLAQTAAICNILEEKNLPVVMGGDFNFTSDSKPYQLISQSFKDAAVVHGNPENTIPYTDPQARIDYLFLSGDQHWEVKEVEVIRDNASDHMPVLVVLELKQ